MNVLDALEGVVKSQSVRERARAHHRAAGYMVEDRWLWCVGRGTRELARARRECVTQEEAVELAREQHEQHGHWHRDGIKLALLD